MHHTSLFINFKFQIYDEEESSRAFLSKQYHYSDYYPPDTSSTHFQDRNDIWSWGIYKGHDYTYDYPHQVKWRRVGQGIDRTFDIIVGAFQSNAIKVSRSLSILYFIN